MEERKKNKKKMDDTQPWMRKLHAPFQKFCKTSTTSSFSLVALIHRIESPPTSFPYPPSTSPLGFSSFFVLSLSLALYFHYSLSIPSSRQPLMMKTQSSIYKILSRSLSFCVPQLDGERGTFFFLLAHPKSSQKGDEKIPHQTSSSFTSFYHRLSENSKRPPRARASFP